MKQEPCKMSAAQDTSSDHKKLSVRMKPLKSSGVFSASSRKVSLLTSSVFKHRTPRKYSMSAQAYINDAFMLNEGGRMGLGMRNESPKSIEKIPCDLRRAQDPELTSTSNSEENNTPRLPLMYVKEELGSGIELLDLKSQLKKKDSEISNLNIKLKNIEESLLEKDRSINNLEMKLIEKEFEIVSLRNFTAKERRLDTSLPKINLEDENGVGIEMPVGEEEVFESIEVTSSINNGVYHSVSDEVFKKSGVTSSINNSVYHTVSDEVFKKSGVTSSINNSVYYSVSDELNDGLEGVRQAGFGVSGDGRKCIKP